ncbi:MAG: imidazolonepropionase [Solirubrobacterales bacterium]|nr:imidazolonepropionase [Solirubrobacterales bacterium]MBV9716335.1 imidazolonepropionase [Solirubrobacterales bacterium]
MSASINGAAQILRPPADGMPYLRHDRAAELSAEPGSVSTAGDDIAAFEAAADAEIQIDARGCAVIPGFVDCHTHLPFAGWREREYELKIAGASYERIAREGGGIRASARSLAATGDEQVLSQARALALEMLAHGTTTVEAKSGYGLSAEQEIRSVRLAAELSARIAQPLSSTALLAHAVPDGYDTDGWMGAVESMLPAVLAAGRVTALDIYVESVAFANRHLERMGELAAGHGLDLRAHVEQFSCQHSVPVALAAGARSVDHLACLAESDLPALASAETAAVLLPGAEFMGAERVAPARALADAGGICVLGSDLNPGTSPVLSMPLVIGLAVRRYGWSVTEALLAGTLNAAWVLRRSQRTGSLEVGKRADVLVLDAPIGHIPYRLGHNPVGLVFVGGRLAHVRPDCAWRVAR